MTRKRLALILMASVLLAGGIGASAPFAEGTADAAPCASLTVAGAPCSITGTLTVTSGTLILTGPPALEWAETENGLDQALVNSTVSGQTYQVTDATGTASGWHITVAATQFTSGVNVLPDTGTFATNGSLGLMTGAAAPTAACGRGLTCTLPTNTTTYPVDVTTGVAVTPVDIYGASALTGVGTVVIGSPGPNPVGWWLNVPSNTSHGTYTSTFSLELVVGP